MAACRNAGTLPMRIRQEGEPLMRGEMQLAPIPEFVRYMGIFQRALDYIADTLDTGREGAPAPCPGCRRCSAQRAADAVELRQ